MCPAASMPLFALKRLSTTQRMPSVWTPERTTPLPESTKVSVITLCGRALLDAARDSLSGRVVLSRVLLKQAFSSLAAAKGSDSVPTADGPTTSELAVRLTLANYDPVIAFSNNLMQMSSVLVLNERIESSLHLASWLGGFAVSNALLPAQINFFSGEALHVAAMAESVCAGISVRLLGDFVLANSRVGRLSANT